MPTESDPGYPEPFLTLCNACPGPEVYPPADFRVEWGPVFHRGRLDGSARCLVIGQDPAQSENIVRRILVGVAGQRAQGLLRKLGFTRSYVLINAFAYSVYGQSGGQRNAGNAGIIAYRNQWLTAIFDNSHIEIILSLGSLADDAWKRWRNANPARPERNLPYAHVTHPTQPESASASDPTKLARNTALLLQNWNAAITALLPGVAQPDTAPLSAAYGTTWAPADIVPIPPADLPPGLPDWMGNADRWVSRVGANPAAKRANITITVPPQAIPSPAAPPGITARPAARADLRAPIPSAPVPHAGLLVLSGTVVTMTSPGQVLRNAILYIRDGIIEAIRQTNDPAPDGYQSAPVINTGALIFPGLIELHNHLAYNALPLWAVPSRFSNRDQWSRLEAYRQLVSGPMGTIADLPGILPALCRYVECKALLGGATTSQGIALVNHNNIRTFFRGLLRNAELTDDPDLPAARARIGDVAALDVDKFRKTLLSSESSYLLHLSEGTDSAARSHFQALLTSAGKWAIAPNLAGIHCVALQPPDFQIMADNGAAMVWSPLSNLLLYGQTANLAAAKAANIRIALGPDWSPSGSKNILGELKVAWTHSQSAGGLFTEEELATMPTRTAANVLGWDALVGTIEERKLADLIVIRGSAANPYRSLISAAETDLQLVVIGGVRRYGSARLMQGAAPELESITVGGKPRLLNLWPPAAGTDNPPLEQLSLKDATDRLRTALANLGTVSPAAPHLRAISDSLTGGWRLALDEIQDTGFEMRTLAGLPKAAAKRGPTRPPVPAAPPKLNPISLDALTVADDPGFLNAIAREPNLPPGFASALAQLY